MHHLGVEYIAEKSVTWQNGDRIQITIGLDMKYSAEMNAMEEESRTKCNSISAFLR